MRSQLRRSTEHSNNLSAPGRTKPTVSPEYIVGLTDGEGCFYVHVRESDQYRAGAFAGLHFHIKMNEKDREVLEKVRNTLECGGVYFQKEQRRNHTQCYRYTVNANRDILGKIIPFFERYPLQSASKRRNFELFRAIGKIVEERRHLTREGIAQVRKLKEQMNKKTVGLA
jgi:hypothetical protein